MFQFLFIVLVFYFIIASFHRIYSPKHPLQLNVYFGVPGSGKTTFAAYLAKHALHESMIIKLCRRFPCRFSSWILSGSHWKRRIDVFSNVPLTGCYKIDCMNDLGVYMVENGKLIIDEAGVEFNNRNYKSLPPRVIKWFKYHRHYGMSVDVFSQSHEDMDITLRRLAQNFYVVKKSLIPFFLVIKRIHRKVGIDDNTHQLIDAYSFGLPVIGCKWVFMPPLWRMFDTYDHEDLEPHTFPVWGE